MRDFLSDLVFGFRMFRKEPGLTLAAVASIAIGVAANTTVFSVANRVLFQDLPVKEPSSLVSISQKGRDGRRGGSLAWPAVEDIRREQSVLKDVAAYFPLVPAGLTGVDGVSKRLWGQLVTGNYFEVAGVPAALGRTFVPEEDKVPGRDFVVVVSHDMWTTLLGADPAIVGRTIRLNQRPFTVVGVAPKGFRGVDVGLVADFWLPTALQTQALAGMHMLSRTDRGTHWLFCIGRLQPGVSVESAGVALEALGKRLADSYPATNKDVSLHVERAGMLSPAFRQSVVTFLALLFVVMALVLLIACANVANLLLARAARRGREIGTRLAIGASRGRLIRQLLTESLLISLCGSVLAMVLASWTQSLIQKVQLPFPVPLDFSTGIDWRVGIFTLAAALATNVAFGLVPALRATKTDLVTALKVTTAEGFGRGKLRLASVLVVGQVAVALLLLTGATLALRSLQNAHTVELGFEPANLLVFSLDPLLDGMDQAKAAQTLTVLQDRLRSFPGVAEVSYTDMLPLSLLGQSTGIHNDKQKSKPERSADFAQIGERYVEAMGMKFVEGSGSLRAKSADAVPAIVNQSLARQFWPQGSALQQRFYTNEKQAFVVVGVIRDAKVRTIGEEDRAAFYHAYDTDETHRSFFGARLLVRLQSRTPGIGAALRREIQTAFPSLSIFDTLSMEEHVSNALILPRIAAVLFGFAGSSALLLAITGLFGVINYSVSRRTREIGIRMAIGAERESVLLMVLRHGLRLSLIGVAIGFAMALAGTRILEGLLYGVKPGDVLTFTLVPVLLLATASVACLVPALRASRLEPMAALREE